MPEQSSETNILTEPINPFKTDETLPGAEDYFNELKRNEVRQIVISYHQTYDHFHEILQNALDACETAFDIYANEPERQARTPYEPHIEIKIDVDGNKLTVADNGEGMTLSKVKRYLFTQYATDKPYSQVRQRGEN